MAKVNALVIGAVVNGKVPGEEVTLEEKDAKYLESIGYIEIKGIVQTPKKTEEKKPTTKPKTKTKDSK